jgi:hypothetical protein
MKVNLDLPQEIDLSTIEYGDVLICKNNVPYLVVADYDGSDYRLVNLKTYTTTDYHCDVKFCLEEIELTVKEVIKKDNLELRRC